MGFDPKFSEHTFKVILFIKKKFIKLTLFAPGRGEVTFLTPQNLLEIYAPFFYFPKIEFGFSVTKSWLQALFTDFLC